MWLNRHVENFLTVYDGRSIIFYLNYRQNSFATLSYKRFVTDLKEVVGINGKKPQTWTKGPNLLFPHHPSSVRLHPLTATHVKYVKTSIFPLVSSFTKFVTKTDSVGLDPLLIRGFNSGSSPAPVTFKSFRNFCWKQGGRPLWSWRVQKRPCLS